MIADYDFYKDVYKGIIIPSAADFDYFGERASDELALYSRKVTANGGEEALEKCACRVADILYGQFKQSKNGVGGLSSESVSGYYSASYATVTSDEVKGLIGAAMRLYLSPYLLRKTVVRY